MGGWECIFCAGEGKGEDGNGQGKSFFSTRKDNFKNHVRRIHGGLRGEGEDLAGFLRR